MEHRIGINQAQAIELGIKKITQAHIFDLLTTASKWAKIETIEQKTFYWVARQKIIEELPILRVKLDTVQRHLKELQKIGVIEYKIHNKKDYIRVTEKGKKYTEFFPKKHGEKSEKTANSENNPSNYGEKSVKNPKTTDFFPTYQDTSIYQNTNNHTLMQKWNRLADRFELNSLSKLSETRKRKIAIRIKSQSNFETLFDKALSEIEKSDYLQGKVNSWKITFDWLITNENNILKVIEGNYRNSKPKERSKTNLNSVPTEFTISEKW